MIKNTVEVLLATIVIGLIVIGACVLFIFRGSDTPLGELTFRQIAIVESEKKAIIAGDMYFSSAKAFYRYSYRIKDNVLILTIKSGLVNPIHRYGDFRIEIVDDRILSVQSIALKNGNEIIPIRSMQKSKE